MKFALRAALPLLTLIASCAQLPPAGTGPGTPVAPAGPTAFVQVGQAAGHTAVLSFGRPAIGYALQQVGHRWEAADVHTYEVELKVRDANGTTYSAIGAGVKVSVPITGPAAASKAVFGNLAHGQVYRAFVTAKGNVGGTAATTTLNSTPATADFDFTQAQDLQTTQDRTVTVVFDGVPFSGTGNLLFGSPAPGAFTNPADGPTVTISAPPTPTPTPVPDPEFVGSFPAGNAPQGIAVDDDGNAWIGTYADASIKVLGPDGATLHTYATGNGKNTSGVAIDSHGKVWVTGPGFAGVWRFDPTTGVPTSFPMPMSGAYAIKIDQDDNIWVGDVDGKLYKLSNDGTLLKTVQGSTHEVHGLAITSDGDVWVAGYQASSIFKFDNEAAPLKTVALSAPREMAIGADDTLYVLGGFGANWTKVSDDGLTVQAYDHPGLELSGLGIDGEGKLWIGNYSVTGKLRRFTTANVKEEEFTTTGFYGFGQIAIDKAHRRVWKTNYHTGSVSVATY